MRLIYQGYKPQAQTFAFAGIAVTVIIDELGNPWWIAKEVCTILGLDNVSAAVSTLNDDEKNYITLTKVIRGTKKRTIISEPGLYRLIGKSEKEEAKLFQIPTKGSTSS